MLRQRGAALAAANLSPRGKARRPCRAPGSGSGTRRPLPALGIGLDEGLGLALLGALVDVEHGVVDAVTGRGLDDHRLLAAVAGGEHVALGRRWRTAAEAHRLDGRCRRRGLLRCAGSLGLGLRRIEDGGRLRDRILARRCWRQALCGWRGLRRVLLRRCGDRGRRRRSFRPAHRVGGSDLGARDLASRVSAHAVEVCGAGFLHQFGARIGLPCRNRP